MKLASPFGALLVLGCAAVGAPAPTCAEVEPAAGPAATDLAPAPGSAVSSSERRAPARRAPVATTAGADEWRPPTEHPFSEVTPEAVDWSAHFSAENAKGAFVLYDAHEQRAWVHGENIAEVPYLPASTYKIPHSIIALELGVVEDADFVLPWDGNRRWNPDWNFDTSLRDALRFSVVPYYQEVARRIGPQRMTAWLDKLEYGNRNIEGGIDVFWLLGKLRISALEQVDFLQRFNDGRLPISARTRRIMRDILLAGRRGANLLRAKTGSADAVDGQPAVKWYVGWVERPKVAPVYFAAVLTQTAPDAWAASRLVSDRILSERSYL